MHNLSEERSIGFYNYEIGIRGKRFTEAASKKIVLNRSSDLIEDVTDKDFRKYGSIVKEIKALKDDWHKKMEELQVNSEEAKDVEQET